MYANGDTYNGLWQEDTMHGKGVMYYKDGSVYEGNWERGEVRDNGIIVHIDPYRAGVKKYQMDSRVWML